MPKDTLDFLRNKVAQALTDEEIDQLRQDLSQQLKVREVADVAQVVPDPEVQTGIQDVVKGNPQQTRAGLLQGAKKGLLGAGVGAVAGGLAQGVQAAPQGLLVGGIPGAMRGYSQGKERERDRQLTQLLAGRYQEPKVAAPMDSVKLLQDKLFPPSDKPPIESTVPPKEPRPSQFRQTLQELKQEKQKGKLTSKGFQSAVSSLEKGRTRKGKSGLLSARERHTLKQEFGKDFFRPQGSPPKSKPLLKKPGMTSLIKSNPKSFAVLGGLAALSALGLSAAKLKQYYDERN